MGCGGAMIYEEIDAKIDQILRKSGTERQHLWMLAEWLLKSEGKIESMTLATEPCPDCGSRHPGSVHY